LVLSIRASCEVFVQAAHVPTHVAELTPPAFDDGLRDLAFGIASEPSLPTIHERRPRKQFRPSLDHFIVGPGFRAPLIDV
jgi:hypothetical protein